MPKPRTLKRIVIPVLVLAVGVVQAGWFTSRTINARSNGLGGFRVCLPAYSGPEGNPASFSIAESPQLSGYFAVPYLMNEMAVKSVLVTFPARPGVISADWSQFGYQYFSEMQGGIGLARKFSPTVEAGLRINWYGRRMAGEPDLQQSAGFSAGIVLNLTDELIIGGFVSNPAGVGLNSKSENMVPSMAVFGFHWAPEKNVGIACSAELDELDGVSLQAGVEYFPDENFIIRTGLRSVPPVSGELPATPAVEPSVGAGWNIGHLTADIATSWNPWLGWSPSFSVSYKFHRESE
ncbi:MAG: hypothetical protein Kow00127_05650 [Bacteroidales bacterium]